MMIHQGHPEQYQLIYDLDAQIFSILNNMHHSPNLNTSSKFIFYSFLKKIFIIKGLVIFKLQIMQQTIITWNKLRKKIGGWHQKYKTNT